MRFQRTFCTFSRSPLGILDFRKISSKDDVSIFALQSSIEMMEKLTPIDGSSKVCVSTSSLNFVSCLIQVLKLMSML